MSCATVVHVSHTQAALVKFLALAQHRRPPITGLEQRHGASGGTGRGSAPEFRVPYVVHRVRREKTKPVVDGGAETGTVKGSKVKVA